MLLDGEDTHYSASQYLLMPPDVQRTAVQPAVDPCHHPLEDWLCATCLQALCFVAAFAIGRRAERHAPWWFLDPQTRTGKTAFRCTWAILLPLLCTWTILGISWLLETLDNTPECFPHGSYLSPPVYACSQILCGLCAIAYAIFVANVWAAQMNRRANAAAIAAIEDDDLVDRWGKQHASVSPDLCGGLLACDFCELPRHRVFHEGGECSICLNGLDRGDIARSLPGCGHVFHRACIDLWLVREPCCPLCKVAVRPRQRRPSMDY